MNPNDLPLITYDRLVRDLRALGVGPGQTVMMHASVKAVGWMVGGPDIILRAMLDVLGPDGTLMMYAAWESSPYDLFQAATPPAPELLEAWPPFDPATARAMRAWSILTEYLRTWPGAHRSGNPEASMVAVGAKAAWLTAQHPLQYGYGLESPLDKLTQCDGRVLLLGASLDSLTLLHYAEHVARVPNKRIVRYQIPFMRDGQKVWVPMEEFDTADPALDGDYTFEEIARAYLATSRTPTGRVGAAHCYLFEAAALARFATTWLEGRFG